MDRGWFGCPVEPPMIEANGLSRGDRGPAEQHRNEALQGRSRGSIRPLSEDQGAFCQGFGKSGPKRMRFSRGICWYKHRPPHAYSHHLSQNAGL